MLLRIHIFLCVKSRAKRAHKARNIGTSGFYSRDLLKGTQYRFVMECTALYYNMLSEIAGIGKLYDFIESILDNRVRKSRGNIRNRRPFLLRLLNVGIHKHGTSCSKVNGSFCEQCFLRKALGGISK